MFVMILKGLNRKKEPIEVKIEKNEIVEVKNLSSSEGLDTYILPGFIDNHAHGGYGHDFTDASKDSTKEYLDAITQEGVTATTHTSITTTKSNLIKSCEVAKKLIKKNCWEGAKLLGVHIEGNYLSVEKRGAHKAELLEPLTIKEVDKLIKASGNNLTTISYAIENSDVKTTKYISSKGIIPSVAHSIARDKEMVDHMKYGLKAVTHTFNAMTGAEHRNPGIVTSALLEDDLYTEIISDGHHVSPRSIKLLYKNKPTDKILIITDSVSPKGMPNGEYKLGELLALKQDDIITLVDGSTLAGSISKFDGNFRNFIKFTGCTLEEASMMSSTNQAKMHGLKKNGYIEKGYLADITILDEKLNVIKTIVEGKVVYEK